MVITVGIGRVGPVQGLIDRQQVSEVVAGSAGRAAIEAGNRVLDQFIAPADLVHDAGYVLNREGGIVKGGVGGRSDAKSAAKGARIGHRVAGAAVAPDRGRRIIVAGAAEVVPDATGEDLLLELPHRNIQIGLGSVAGDPGCRHNRWNDQRGYVLGNRRRVERAARYRGQCRRKSPEDHSHRDGDEQCQDASL